MFNSFKMSKTQTKTNKVRDPNEWTTPAKDILKERKAEVIDKEKGHTNKSLSKDLNKTRKMWTEEGFKKVEPSELLDQFLITDGPYFVKYITTTNLARNGGVLSKIVDEEDGDGKR